MDEKVSIFRAFTEDNTIERKEIVKFIEWGKGDMEQAINYYYKHLEKGKIKKGKSTKNNSPIRSKPPAKVEKEEQEESRQDKNSEIPVNSEEEEDAGLSVNSIDAFSVLKKGSIKHKKTHDFIKKVRDIYKLPIQGKTQKELFDSSKSCLPENDGKIPPEFLMVDCLTQAFDPESIQNLLEKRNQEEPKVEIKKEMNQEDNFRQLRKKNNVNYQEIELSISENNEENEVSEEEEFADLSNYQYKHVYTNPSLKNENLEIFELEENKNNGPIDESFSVKSEKEENVEEDRKDKKKSKAQSFKNSKNEKKPKITVPFEASKEKQTKLSKSKGVLSNNIKGAISEIGPETIDGFSQQLDEGELYIGDYFIRGLCTDKRKFESSCHGCSVEIDTYIEEVKTKKKNFGRAAERAMNMRIRWEGKQVGRIADEEVRIIMPLISKELVRMEFYFQEVPLFADIFKPMTLIAKVFLLKKLITEPITENFEPQGDDKERVDQLSALYLKLNLPIITEPLIKGKSKYIKNEKPKKDKKQSIDIFVYATNEEEEKAQRELEEKKKKEEDRLRNDPTFRRRQTSLLEMISKNEENIRKSIKLSPIIEEEGQVKKKVIEIDSQAEKNKLSELIELHEENIEPYYPEKNFVSHLYPYQALALSWMLRREGFLIDKEEKEELHPLWTEYGIPASDKYRLYFNELTGQSCVRRPVAMVKCKGGILADEMGLGKTVMMTSLIVSNPPSLELKNSDQAGTLVVVPLTLLSQWESEIQKHTNKQKVAIYYSTDRKKIADSLHKYDVVISTYGTISHEFAQGSANKKTGVYKYKWHRIILDEAHYIKGRIIQTSKAVYELNSLYRWCLTGTPIQNTITDMFSLLHFIKYTPWSEFACWNRFIVKPLEEEDPSIYQILRSILKQVFLRRTKTSKGPDGKPIIELPPRISKVELLTMNDKEREFYQSIYDSSKSNFDDLIDKGILEAKYMQVLEMLMRLRQICCHPILFKSVAKFSKSNEEFESDLQKLIKKSAKRKINTESQSEDDYYEPIFDADNEEGRMKVTQANISEEYFKEVLAKVANDNLDNCIICLSQPEDPVITCCMHIFCKACNIRQIEEKGSCSFCRMSLGKEDWIYLPRENRLNINKGGSEKEIFPSTKMVALNEHLDKLDPLDKVVVFSQFLGMLDLLEDQFEKKNLKYVRMEGSTTHKERTRIVKSFQEDPTVQIFLVSLKTAGVGLNLVAANKVFLMDPWWNPAVEEQAIERVHRIGQKREVQIVRFIIDRTIEARMLELNTEKKALSQSVLNQENIEPNHKIEKLKYLMENY